MGQMQRHVFDPAKGFADMVSTTGGRVIYVSGHLGFGPDGKTVVEGGLGAQADALFDNIEETLAQGGATLDDLVRITAYIVDLDAYSEYAEVRRLRLGNNPPASTTVGVASLLAGALIEIDGVAFVAD